MKRLSILLLLCLYGGSVPAITLNATKIGPVFTTTPVGEVAFQALTGFRGAFTPLNLGMTVGTTLVVAAMSDGINSLRAQVGANVLPPVPGWSNPNTPPNNSSVVTGYGDTCNNNAPVSFLEACKSRVYSTVGGSCSYSPTSNFEVTVNGTTCNWRYVPNGNTGSFGPSYFTTVNTCAAGYVYSSGTCVLTDPAVVKWPSDGIPTIHTQNGVWQWHSRDPDNSTGTPPFSRNGTDAFQNPVVETVTPNAVNGIDYQRDTQSVNPQTGEPMIQRDKFSTDADGQVISVTTQTYNNSTIGNVNTSNTTNNQQIDTQGLAQETTLQQVKDLLDPQTAPDLTDFGQPVTEKYQTVITEIQNISPDSPNPAAQLQIPEYWSFASGTCYPAEFDAGRFGKVSFSSFCQIYDDHIRGLIVFILGVWSVLHVFSYWAETVREI